jgi:2-keto-4-pentenoate hydratase/2-oxohepta-3-ene-1,7-dioic acid hydratase in catechol pathway
MMIQFPGRKEPLRPGKILCIGRNYAAHAAEMQSEVPEEPMVFLKPSTALVGEEGAIELPAQSTDVHHEVELVALIGKSGKNISAEQALSHVAGYAVGLDMTARDIQSVAKKKGHPWSIAKGFDTFAPLGSFVSAAEVADPQALEITLEINGEMRQHGSTADMMFSVADLVAYCSTIFTLEEGDLIYTGTPEGVGQVHAGDELVARVRGLPELRITVR